MLNTITQDIPLNRLVHSKANVRKTGRSRAIEALMASIAAHGLRQNLNVKPTTGNRFEVVAGGRRLEALKRLMKDGRIGRDVTIPCIVLSGDENPAEISLAENEIRETMHPDDQCSAFQQLIDDGMSVDDVAARFGVTVAVVRQRLKLANVAPTLRARFRKGELDLSEMMALALIDDHAQQEAIWHDLPEWNRNAASIRRSLTTGGVESNHRFVKFVGIEAYEAAGGTVIRDLFDEDQPAILADAALVEQLVVRKLEEEAAHLQAEGWKWVKIEITRDYSVNYGRVYPQEIEGSDDEAYAPDDIARAGARITLDHDGELDIDRGLIDADTIKAERKGQAKQGAPGVIALPESLVEDLTGHRTAALRLEVARNPHLGLAAIVHVLGIRLIYDDHRVPSSLTIVARSASLEPHVKSKSECTAHDAFDQLLADARTALPRNAAEFWDWCVAAPTDTLLKLLAVMAGQSVDAVRVKHAVPSRHADQLADALALDMHSYWTPAPDGFFSRMSKSLMAQTLNEVGESGQAAAILKCKKPEAAARTATTLLQHGWLPAALLPQAFVEDVEVDLDEDDDSEGDDCAEE